MSQPGLRFKSIKGYSLTQVIGGGGFSKVYLAFNPTSQLTAACKVISIASANAAENEPPRPTRKELEKEVKVHRMLKHAHILGFLDAVLVEEDSGWVPGLFVLLELAAGGDLFDKIAPDRGISDDLAHYFFNQLLSGVEFIHSKGIAHRDLKPENLLLDAHGNIKISDFGLCSVFKLNGKERSLSGRCGSLPYIAPELNEDGNYRAEPVDIWGCGVVLFTLLCGNTPWDEPTEHSPEFVEYVRGNLWAIEPWSRLQGDAQDLMARILHIDPRERITIKELWSHPWCIQRPSQFMSRQTLAQRLLEGLASQGEMDIAEPSVPLGFALSQQPASQRPPQAGSDTDMDIDMDTDMDDDDPTVRMPPGSITQDMAFTQNVGMVSQWSPDGTRYLVPELTRCFSLSPPSLLLPILFAIVGAMPASHPLLLPLSASDTLPAMDADEHALGMQPTQGVRSGEKGGRIKFLLRDSRRQLLEGALLVRPVRDSRTDAVGSLVVMKRAKGDPMEWRKLWYQIRDSPQMQIRVYKPSAGSQY